MAQVRVAQVCADNSTNQPNHTTNGAPDRATGRGRGAAEQASLGASNNATNKATCDRCPADHTIFTL